MKGVVAMFTIPAVNTQYNPMLAQGWVHNSWRVVVTDNPANAHLVQHLLNIRRTTS